VRLDGNDQIGIASADFHIRLIERMRTDGFQAVGAENLVFDKDESRRAQFLLGGTVREVACNETWRSLNCRMGVEWQLLDVATEAVVYKVTSRVAVLDSSDRDKSHMSGMLLDRSIDSVLKRDAFRRTLTEKQAAAEEPSFEEADVARCAPGRKVTESADDSLDRVVIVKMPNGGFGSGFFVGTEGLILTAGHVVTSAVLQIQTHAGIELEAVPVRVNKRQDVALIRTSKKLLAQHCMALRQDAPRSGSTVYAIGAPTSLELAFSLTRGIVSGFPMMDGRRRLQSDAPTSPGNSGGPLVDEDASVVGVVVSKISGGRAEGIGFAVPVPEALSALGLHVGAATDPRLLTEVAPVAAQAESAAFTDKPDRVPSIDPDGDRRRAEEERDAARDADARSLERELADHDRGNGPGAAAPEGERKARTPKIVPVMLWGGMTLAAAGIVDILATYASFDAVTTTEAQYESLRTWNTVGWVATGVGAVGVGMSFLLRPSVHLGPDPGAGGTSLELGPAGARVRGSF
jgi:S1-C subfamily serine protease